MTCFLNAEKLLLFRVFDGKLITKFYPLPPNDGEDKEYKQQLDMSLAGLSLRCGSCPPGAVTSLSIPDESAPATVLVLSDHSLAVIFIQETSANAIQVYYYGAYCGVHWANAML